MQLRLKYQVWAKGFVIGLLNLILCLAPSTTAFAQANQSGKPKLVVLLVADQFSADYLSRYQDKFVTGGFKFLLDNGANFVSCSYAQATTQTAPGHSTIATGAYPWATGIVANDWYDQRKGKQVSAVFDESTQLVGGNGPAGSNHAMYGTTVGDQLKLASNGKSKVVSMSLKDRAALFLAGRLANYAFWWDMKTGNFVTSSQYGRDLPVWAKTVNDQHFADRYLGKPWQRLLPENQYTASSRDDYAYERPFAGDGRQFPHVITGGASSPGEQFYATFAMTPWANQMLANFAQEAIDKESLGQRPDVTDLISISFSAGDYLGHAFGPYSQEMEDLMLRLDQTLANFFQFLDQRVGLDRCLLVMTSDHAVMPIPEFLKEKGLEGGRIDPKAFANLLDASLDSRVGSEDWIASFQPPNLYLNLAAVDKEKVRQPDVEALAAKIARSVPGIGNVYTAFQFYLNQMPVGPECEAVKRNYYWGRSGELFVLTKPNWIFISEPNGTTHGSPYAYDSHVPLIFCGTRIQAGCYGKKVSPADIAPTIAAILGISPPSLCEGRVLTEALGQFYGPPRPRNFMGTQELSTTELSR